MSLPYDRPDFNGSLVQTYPNNGNPVTITTVCMVSIENDPPFVTNYTPIDQSLFLGPENPRYIVYLPTGQHITQWVTPQSGNEEIKIG